MKRVLSVTMAFLLLGSTAAFARDNHNRGHYGGHNSYYRHNGHGDDAAAAIGAGILGFALGALASSQNQANYAPAYPPPPAYAPPPTYYGAYGTPYTYAAPAYGYATPAYGYGAPAVNFQMSF